MSGNASRIVAWNGAGATANANQTFPGGRATRAAIAAPNDIAKPIGAAVTAVGTTKVRCGEKTVLIAKSTAVRAILITKSRTAMKSRAAKSRVREEPRRERVSRPRGEREQSSQYQDEADVRRPRYEPPVFVTWDEPPPESPRVERAPPWPPENDRDEFVDQAVAEITARQRALDSAARAKPPRRQPTLETDVRAETTVARRPVHYAAADIAAPQRTIAADAPSNQRLRKFRPTTR